MTLPMDGVEPCRVPFHTGYREDLPISLAGAIAAVDSQTPTETDLERLTAAIALARAQQRSAEDLVEHFVANARAQGQSWDAIARVLKVSKQAAHKRFSTHASEQTEYPDPPKETAHDST